MRLRAGGEALGRASLCICWYTENAESGDAVQFAFPEEPGDYLLRVYYSGALDHNERQRYRMRINKVWDVC